ncbi:MAG: heat-inducible transcriptional repressor HrcA [Peptococcaceae bacterium]|jgi:heat-inducible transcriptional repressor|nr:heat-inducible transcriptional repressor HrcA [Peptococcaceae bacterium]MDR2736019.1 heat-inducible transcriptional repressor HrcA [Gracilibacteraceae bacterium]
MEIDERKRKILWAIIQDYIASAEPVGSRTLSRKYDLGVSSATIRNEMSDLEEMGYIEQPHTSSGRIPSELGYRYYVDYLMEPLALDQGEADLIQNEIASKIDEVDNAFAHTASLISRLTQLTSVVISQNRHSAIKMIHFLPYHKPGQIIMLTVWDDGKVENAVVDIGEEVSAQELQTLTNIFNDKVGSVSPGKLKEAVLQEVHNELVQKKYLIDQLLHSVDRMMESQEEEAINKVFYGGTLNMINQPEFKNFDKIKDLFGVFEERNKIIGLLPRHYEGLRVQIGSENHEEVFQDCSLITATYKINGMPIGSFGILGPTRMDYRRVVAMVKFVAESLSFIISSKTFDS